MLKVIKLVLGLLLLSALGLGYGKFNEIVQEKKEDIFYSYISYSYPGDEIKSVQIKRTPESKCEKWRNDYFVASSEQCKGCTVLANECRKEIPQNYKMAFEQKDINISYIYKPYKYPEVTIYVGLPEGSFSQLCTMEKGSLESTVCFE